MKVNIVTFKTHLNSSQAKRDNPPFGIYMYKPSIVNISRDDLGALYIVISK